MANSELSDERKDEILRLAQAECDRAIGFDNINASELTSQREKALQYFKGEMPDLVMELAGRSKVVDTAVADAIETALPDLIDIFTGGEDVVAFQPVNKDDENAANQEQDYLRHVLFDRNNGWMVIYEAFKDALTCKTGVFSWRWDGEFEPQADQHENVGLPVLMRCAQEGTVENVVPGPADEDGLPTVSFDYTPKYTKGRIVVESIAPEDLAVAADTKTLATATYCAVRQRPRAQDLISMGYDLETVMSLPAWNSSGNAEGTARDTVAESDAIGSASDLLRQVEIYRHYVRVYSEETGRYCLYQLVTGGQAHTNVLLDIEEVSRVQLAAITPYINPHRFYGESVADKLLEIQKIKTSMMRAALDSAYFALNQRSEIDINGITPDTINDYLNNEPGRPVRVKRSGTITPLGNGALPYNPLDYLEFFETQGEKRTGIARNVQGINPDTLHDTKGGMEILANNAQKRLRLIARTFAETGYKDFLVNLHATIRENGACMKDTVRLRNEWVDIDPSTWRQRDDMIIQIGVGAGGREHDLMVGAQIAVILEKLAAAQTMPDGPLVTKKGLYRAAVDQMRKLGEKAPEQYVNDPDTYKEPEATAPPPDAAVMKVQADAEAKARELDLEEQKAKDAYDLKSRQLEEETRLKDQQIAAEIELERYKIDKEYELKAYEIQMRALGDHGTRTGGGVSLGSDGDGIDANVQFGGGMG